MPLSTVPDTMLSTAEQARQARIDAGFALKGITVLTGSGTYTPAATVKAFRVQMVAGGGAGGAAALNKTSSASSAGGNGSIGTIIITEYV